MANPADPGTFDLWITNRIGFKVTPPKSGETGDFERWVTNRIDFGVYVEAEVVVSQAYPGRNHPRRNILLRL